MTTRKRSRALTLIEVLAALVILGGVLVGVMLAKSRHTHQLFIASCQSDIAKQADKLLGKWYCSESGFPVGKSGNISGKRNIKWQCHIVSNSKINSLNARVLRCEFVLDGSDLLSQEVLKKSRVVVDVVIDAEEKAEDRRK